MFHRTFQRAVVLLTIFATTILMSACGGSTATPTVRATATLSGSASGSASGASQSASPAFSASPQASPSATPTENLGLQHVNAALEDSLPSIIGNVQLEKMSLPLSTYIHSSQGQDKALYTPWMVLLGKDPDNIDVAIAVDLTVTENFFIQAIQVPGVNAATLSGDFAQVARDRKWPTAIRSIASKTVLEITDPTVEGAGGIGTAHVYAHGNVLFVIVTDDANLLVEALIKLP